MRGLPVWLAVYLLCAPAASLAASEDKIDRETLRGITSVSVVVESLESDAVRDGLTVDQIQTDVELRLRKARIGVRDSGATHTPFLYINAHLIKGSGPTARLYVFDCQVALVQPVRVVSNGVLAVAPTWSAEITGGIGASEMSRAIRADIGDLVDKFINAYLTVNSTK